eukprot:Opistho-2@57322
MALVDDPLFIVRQLQYTWTMYDDSGMSELVITDHAPVAFPSSSGRPGANASASSLSNSVNDSDVSSPSDSPPYSTSYDIMLSPSNSFTQASRAVGRAEEGKEQKGPDHKVVVFKDKDAVGLSAQPLPSDPSVFYREAIPPPAGNPSSKLTLIVKGSSQKVVTTPFQEYAQFGGDGQVGMARTVPLEIFFPFAEDEDDKPLKLVALGNATVDDVIGLIAYKYTEAGRMPKLTSGVENYCLRMVEDDGSPDMDFPALDRKQPIQKFGFDQLALCETGKGGGVQRKMSSRPDPKSTTTFIRIHVPSQGCTVLNVKSCDILLSDVLDLVRKKRALPKGQHTLELVDSPGVELDLNQTLQSIHVMEFNLIHKFSKRRDIQEDVDKTKNKDVENSLTVHQYKSYEVWAKHKFSGNQEMMIGIDADKISVIPYGTLGFFQKQKLVSHDMDDVVNCQLLEEKSPRTFRFCHFNGTEFKNHYFEAKVNEEAKEIVNKIRSIIESRPSEARTNYIAYQERKLRKKSL